MNILQFGEVDLYEEDKEYEGSISFDNTTIQLCLSIEEEPDIESLRSIEKYLKCLRVHLYEAYYLLIQDFQFDLEPNTVREYMEHHISEFPDTVLLELFDTLTIDVRTFFSEIVVKSITFNPDYSDSFVVIDMKLPDKYTDYTLVCEFDSEFELDSIEIES
ncbi:MAG: DUF2004 domain-containing protein [Candidatus Cloacimonetes bacterium]|nr:DUF2004 domain-containing protein [Candidatus Cloacimonadota bacterium]